MGFCEHGNELSAYRVRVWTGLIWLKTGCSKYFHELPGSMKRDEYLEQLNNCQIIKKDFTA
jgi:hypothetical protein